MITSGTSVLPPTGQFTASEESAITDAFHSFSTAQAEVLGPITRAGAVAGMVPVIGPPTANLLSELLVFTDVSRDSVSGRDEVIWTYNTAQRTLPAGSST